jgi:hypothetical protein
MVVIRSGPWLNLLQCAAKRDKGLRAENKDFVNLISQDMSKNLGQAKSNGKSSHHRKGKRKKPNDPQERRS